MHSLRTRNLVRVLIATSLSVALLAFAMAPVPDDLPALALEQTGLYRLEVALLVFYGALLLITPAFSGLIRGQLPIEISTRGAKFADEADRSTLVNETAIEELERRHDRLAEDLFLATAAIDKLKKDLGDST